MIAELMRAAAKIQGWPDDLATDLEAGLRGVLEATLDAGVSEHMAHTTLVRPAQAMLIAGGEGSKLLRDLAQVFRSQALAFSKIGLPPSRVQARFCMFCRALLLDLAARKDGAS